MKFVRQLLKCQLFKVFRFMAWKVSISCRKVFLILEKFKSMVKLLFCSRSADQQEFHINPEFLSAAVISTWLDVSYNVRALSILV